MKVLFIVPYPSEGASNRFRVEQYLPYLAGQNISYRVRPFLSRGFYKIAYLQGNYLRKTLYFAMDFIRRIFDILSVRKFDIVFIHREACPFGPPLFEWIVHLLGKPLIYDFDDAIFLRNYNPVNTIFSSFKFPGKINTILKLSSAVIVSNNYLKEFAASFNKNVHVIPTPIDTGKFYFSPRIPSKKTTIGWVGSSTTKPYLDIIALPLQRLARQYNIVFKVIGAHGELKIPGLEVEGYSWSLENEVAAFKSIDIGVYPLPDNLWARGKAAFKAIQYMSVGAATVASPVGMTIEVIENRVNGFLASTDDEWFEAISILIEDPALRNKIVTAARETIQKKYSVAVNAPSILKVLNSVRSHSGS